MCFRVRCRNHTPETDSTKAINAHRFILYHLHKLDIKDGTKADKHAIRCILADLNYGTHPDDYKKAKRVEKVTGVREGLVSPLELRRAEPPLPEERCDRVLRTIAENQDEIAKAFKQEARVVGLRGATGDGKTESVIIVAKNGKRVAMTLPNFAGCGADTQQIFRCPVRIDFMAFPFSWVQRRCRNENHAGITF